MVLLDKKQILLLLLVAAIAIAGIYDLYITFYHPQTPTFKNYSNANLTIKPKIVSELVNPVSESLLAVTDANGFNCKNCIVLPANEVEINLITPTTSYHWFKITLDSTNPCSDSFKGDEFSAKTLQGVELFHVEKELTYGVDDIEAYNETLNITTTAKYTAYEYLPISGFVGEGDYLLLVKTDVFSSEDVKATICGQNWDTLIRTGAGTDLANADVVKEEALDTKATAITALIAQVDVAVADPTIEYPSLVIK